MTDQTTPVTDDDRRKAHAQCDKVENNPTSYEDEAHAIARAIRAHVPAPPKSLADELRKIIIDLEHHDMDSSPDGRGTWQVLDATASLRDLADRAEAVEANPAHPDCEACRTGYDCTCRNNPRCPNYQETPMTDWTTPEDVPADTVDRLHRWLLQEGNPADAATPGERAVADIIRAFWPVPDPTLAEQLQYRADLLDNGDPDGDTPQALRDLAARAAQMEHDLAEAATAQNAWPKTTPSGHTYDEPTTYKELRRQCANVAQAASEGWDDAERPPEPTWEMVGLATAEVEGLNFEKEVREAINDHYDRYAAQERAESSAESLDPADVKPCEAWLVEVDGERRNAVKDNNVSISWNTVNSNGQFRVKNNKDITLISRLVPAPRVITDPDELDKLATRAVILSTDGQADVYQKDSNGEWLDVASYGYSSRQVIRMGNAVKVLWEPEA